MHLTAQHIADEFLAAVKAVGLKQVSIRVGKIEDGAFLVTLTLPNPVSFSKDDEFFVYCYPHEFDDAKHVRQIAAARAQMLAEALPTIH